MKNGVEIVLVAAVASNGVVGLNQKLPWNLPADLKRFKALTLGHPILMGRKTFESIGRILPGRQSRVMSRNPELPEVPGDRSLVQWVKTLDEAIAMGSPTGKLMVVGGGEVYKMALPVADRLELTRISQDFDGDAYFPDVDWDSWKLESSEPLGDSELSVNFETWKRKS